MVVWVFLVVCDGLVFPDLLLWLDCCYAWFLGGFGVGDLWCWYNIVLVGLGLAGYFGVWFRLGIGGGCVTCWLCCTLGFRVRWLLGVVLGWGYVVLGYGCFAIWVRGLLA